MIQREIIISNQLGFHVRAIAKFVARANRYSSHLQVRKESQTVDGRSIMALLMLGANLGTTLELIAEGPDEEPLIEDLCLLITKRFHEEDGHE